MARTKLLIDLIALTIRRCDIGPAKQVETALQGAEALGRRVAERAQLA